LAVEVDGAYTPEPTGSFFRLLQSYLRLVQ